MVQPPLQHPVRQPVQPSVQQPSQHRLDPTPETVADTFSRDRAPVLSVQPGDSLVVRSLDASGYVSRQCRPGDPQPTLIPDARGHCLTGPIEVVGARPGQLLALHLRSLTPDLWGWTVTGADSPLNQALGTAGEQSWLLWEVDLVAGTATNDLGMRIRTAPFLGVLGTAPAEAGEHSTIPPRATNGGNIDCRELVAGSTVYLPVTVPGALLSLGDGHAAQGDGEVGGTAVECAMTTELTVYLVDPGGAAPLTSVHAVTPTGRVTMGFDADLNRATTEALGAMLTWMQALLGVDRPAALAVASTCVDLRVTQVANQVWGVHAVLGDDRLIVPAPS